MSWQGTHLRVFAKAQQRRVQKRAGPAHVVGDYWHMVSFGFTILPQINDSADAILHASVSLSHTRVESIPKWVPKPDPRSPERQAPL